MSFAMHTLRSPAAWLRFVLTAAIGIAADLGTKAWAFATLTRAVAEVSPGHFDVAESATVRFIPGYLHFYVTENHGAVFGIGQGQVGLFMVVSIAAIAFLFYLVAASRAGQWVYQIILGMLLAGVVGNFYDRMVYGHVRDMIHILPKWDVFPWIFNIADSLLCVGVACMLIYSFLAKPERQSSTSE